ncbi:MurR/RpiR family transcriptional regulator [Paenibacillus sp. SYP-B3998]|uniref:MurR/RpiR family transcriptional regulator n=1 Tax=Paenibacillus sp. SYP-B3998 TaxID=2678564 RepID=A0A6G3ZTK7_9BACL|nr:MurR/RpiR family transcriptional regulator [Paenibacillus sp. SYP-B3998]NEW04921.1 MurR/RpiR family transcriptional regulator [Paenibacillus sp. SYP-B3998]
MLKGVLISIEGAYDSLSSMEKRVAKYIMDQPKDIISMSVQRLAEETKVSEATIVRLSRSLKCKGFKELKLRIAADLALLSENADEFHQFQIGSSMTDLVESVSHNNNKSIRDSLTVLSTDMVGQAIQYLNQARKIGLFGIGASAVVAEDFKIKVLRINKWCETGFDGDIQAIIASNMMNQDVALGISYSGTNEDVLHALRIAKANGAIIISLTQFGSNPIADIADIQLFTSTLEQNFRNGATASRIAQLNVIDILYVGMVTHNYKESIDSIERTKKAVRNNKA